MQAPCASPAAAGAPWRAACRRGALAAAVPARWLPTASWRRCSSRRAAPAAPAAAAGAQGGDDPQRWTRLNKPVVRQQQAISYGQFLSDVRSQAVKEVVLTQEGVDRALVVYKDGRVRYVQFPADDARVADVMATYGVTASQAPPEPTPPDSPAMRKAKDAAMYWTPAALIFVVYAVVQYMARNKGDWEDRVKLRQLAEKERREAREKAAQEALEEEAAARRAAQSPEEAPRNAGDGMGLEEAATFMRVDAKRVYKRRTEDAAADGDAAAGSADAAAEPPKADGAAGGSAPAGAPPPRKRKPRSKADTSDLKLRHDERVTFADVAGIGAAKTELMEVVDFFLKPEKYKRSGSRVPKGVLLVGPPGTGKTLLARAVAGEAGCDFFSITASEFVEMFVGVGAARVRSLFEQAKAAAPAIIFIDELDAVGRKRGGGGSGNDERDQTLNQLLSELDGFDASARGLVVIAATNRPDVLDAALVRPGRFDRKVYVPAPDAEGRVEILRVHAGRKPLAPDVDLADVAAETRGFTGAALANLVNVAALAAAREQAPAVSQRHLLAALETETLGKPVPRADAARPPDLLRRLAVSRAAAALAQELLPQLPGVELVSVAAREASPGGFMRAYVDDARDATGVHTAAFLRERAVAALAPRAAEEMLYGVDAMSIAHEAAIAEARLLCSRAVLVGGFAHDAPQLGRRALAYAVESGDFLGGAEAVETPHHVGPATLAAADAEVAAALEDAYAQAKRLLQQHRAALDALVDALCERRTLSGEEVRAVAGGLPAKHAAPALDVQARTVPAPSSR